MTTVGEVLRAIEALAPTTLAESWDNVGLLAGRAGSEVTRLLVTLDISLSTIDEAAEKGCQLIVSHHPVLFSAKSVTDQTPQGQRLLALLENRIAAICMHTNLDAAEGGVNDALVDFLGLAGAAPLCTSDGRPCLLGRVGELPSPVTLQTWAASLSERLDAPVRYGGQRPVRRVALSSGSGGAVFSEALASGCDTFLTGDVKHNLWLDARDAGVNLVDCGHFATERLVVRSLAEKLRRALPPVTVYESSETLPFAEVRHAT